MDVMTSEFSRSGGQRPQRLLLTAVAIALSLSTTAPLLAKEAAAVTPSDVTGVKSLDEVVVTGNLESLSAAKKAVVEAENRFYARYNDLNKDDRFDINCRMETPSDHHSRFTTRVCDPAFVDEGTHVEAMQLFPSNGLGSGDVSVTLASASSIRKAGMPELRRRTLELIRKDPELMRALLERAKLQEHYEALRAKKSQDRPFSWD
ncbi:MAG: hypothetical protein ABI859_18160 [Pseudomonadota bacterium]